MKRAVIVGALVVAALPLLGLLAHYGTLSPCQMLSRDLIRRDAERESSPLALIGIKLAAEASVAARTPWECTRYLVALHSGQIDRDRAEAECVLELQRQRIATASLDELSREIAKCADRRP